MDFFVGCGSRELFDPAFRHQILLEIVGCTGLGVCLTCGNKTENSSGASTSRGSGAESQRESPKKADTVGQSNRHNKKNNINNNQKRNDGDRSSIFNSKLMDIDVEEEEEEEYEQSLTKVTTTTASAAASMLLHPMCIVKLAQMEVHRTKALFDKSVQKDHNPIWTVLTDSLSLLEIPNVKALDEAVEGSPHHILRQQSRPAIERALSFELWQCTYHTGPKILLGTVMLTLDQVYAIAMNQPGQRLEFPVRLLATTMEEEKDGNNNNKPRSCPSPILALQMRMATIDDLIFLGKHPPRDEDDHDGEEEEDEEVDDNSDLVPSATTRLPDTATKLTRCWAKKAADMEFKEVRGKSIFKSYRKVDKFGTKIYRVLPGPDPYCPPETTEWMNEEQILQTALRPSYHFVHAGTGSVGKCFVEVLGAQNLPNMDLNVCGDNCTDPFAAMIFEDSLVRTDMLWDELNPRWMPWTMRAFCFHIRHPQSLLYLGIFDYDEVPLDFHDAVGRVVINIANFTANTTYLLHYDLQHDPRYQPEDEGRGQVQIRLRVEWQDEVQMHKLSFTAPPKCIINCETDKSFQVVRYLKRGPVDMEASTMETMRVYLGEVALYWRRYCHFLDILFEVLLWRGRLHLSYFGFSSKDSKASVWFPIHSIALSTAVLLSLEYPHLIGPIFFYAIAWMLLAINFHNSRHPYPWKQCRKWMEYNYAVLTGHSLKKEVRIEASTEDDWVVRAGHRKDKVDEWRGKRMSALIGATLSFYNGIYQIYSTTIVTARFFSTKQNTWTLLGSKLTYPHMALKYLCKYSRLYLGFINWDGYGANNVVLKSLLIATVWLFIPFNAILLWVCRILAWTLLGPWMKLVDIYWVHSWYKTSNELAELVEQGVEEPDPDLPDYDSILHSGWIKDMADKGRLVAEHALKLKDMRDHRFGRYSEFIPSLDESRYPSIPLPQSTAEPFVSQARPANATTSSRSVDLSTTELAATAHLVTPSRFVACQKLYGTMIMEHVRDSFHVAKKSLSHRGRGNGDAGVLANGEAASAGLRGEEAVSSRTPPPSPPGRNLCAQTTSGNPELPVAASEESTFFCPGRVADSRER